MSSEINSVDTRETKFVGLCEFCNYDATHTYHCQSGEKLLLCDVCSRGFWRMPGLLERHEVRP